MRNFFARLLYAVGLCPVSQREELSAEIADLQGTCQRQQDAIALVARENGRLNADLAKLHKELAYWRTESNYSDAR